MNDAQKKAVAQLARAFAAAKKANLAFCGMDDSLLAYDRSELMAAEKRKRCLYEAQRECDCGEKVKTSGTYLDSGGW